MIALFVSLLLSAAVVANGQEVKKVPSDSVEVDARGCLKGRVFTATGLPDDENTRRGADITGRNFRVSGERDVGIVRKAALDDQGIGMRVGKGARVVIGAPGTDPTRMNTVSSAPSVATMDVTAVRMLADRCPIQ
jgi:hypothetical protein